MPPMHEGLGSESEERTPHIAAARAWRAALQLPRNGQVVLYVEAQK